MVHLLSSLGTVTECPGSIPRTTMIDNHLL